MKFRALGAAFAALALLVACSSQTPSDPPSEGPSSTEKITLDFESLAWQPQSIKANKAIVAAWNQAHPNVQVTYVQGDWGSIGDQLTTEFQAGKAPDVFHFYDGGLQTYAVRGDLLDLQQYLQPDFKSDIRDAAWKNVSFDGMDGVWGVPFLQEPVVIYANKAMLTRSGVRVPTVEKPWTWDEFQDAAKAMTVAKDGKTGVFGAAIPLKDGGVDNTISMGLSFGAQYFSPDGKAAQWGPAEAEVPARFHRMMYEDKSMSTDVLGLASTDVLPGFFAGKTAMVFGGSFIRQQLHEDSPKGLDWVTLPPPLGQSQAQSNGAQTISVAAQTKHPKEAAEFLQYFLNPENQAQLALGDWETPTSIKAGQTPKMQDASLGWDVVIAQSANLVQGSYQRAAGYEEFVSKVAGPTFASYYKNETSIEDLGAKLIKDGDPILKRAASR